MLWSNKPPLALLAGQEEMVPGILSGQELMAGKLTASKDESMTAALLNGHSILNQILNTLLCTSIFQLSVHTREAFLCNRQ